MTERPQASKEWHPVAVPPLRYNEVEAALATAIPEFRPAIGEHVEVYGELLPHVLFGDLTRFVLAARARQDQELVQRSLAFLEDAMREGDQGVRDLVAVSFVENIGPWDDAVAPFISEWPDALRQAAEAQQNQRPGDA